jgi:hypothetical protein
MDLGPGWIKRDDLLKALRQQGLSVSNHQLLRWHNAGILTQPKRVGHGRNRGGSDSYYPWWGALQALEIGWRLKEERRHGGKPKLVDVGWALWVLGYPVTDFARRRLIENLEEKERLLKEMKRRPKQTAVMFRRILQRDPRFRKVRQLVMNPTVAFGIVRDMELGDLQADRYSEWDWQQLREAVLAQLFPDQAGDEPDLPPLDEVAEGIGQLAKTLNTSAIKRGLEVASNRDLRVYCNEAQAILGSLAGKKGWEDTLITPDDFLRHFGQRIANPYDWREMVELLPQLNLPKSPLSAFEQLLRKLEVLPSPALTTEVRTP